MKSRYIFSLVVLLAVLCGLMFSPFGYLKASSAINAERLEETKKRTYEQNVETMETAIVNAVNAFNDMRTFDVYYGDIAKLNEIFAGLAGIEVQQVSVVNPHDNFSEVKIYEEGDQCLAVRYDLLATDITVAMSVIEKMQLPLCSITAQQPNIISIIFLTGGEI